MRRYWQLMAILAVFGGVVTFSGCTASRMSAEEAEAQQDPEDTGEDDEPIGADMEAAMESDEGGYDDVIE